MAELLPRLYQRWIDELLPAGIPSETRATCATCAMLDRGDAAAPDVPFLATTKCCTYYPELPNFTVGWILAETTPEGHAARRVLEQRLQARAGVNPAAVLAPAGYMSAFQGSGPAFFGRTPSLRCPFYVEEGGQCGIWRHREAVCATFFCKYVRGAVGRSFWRVLQAWLKRLETGLRTYCVEQLDPGGKMAMATWVAESAREVGPSYGDMWGPWVGREGEWFAACARLVEPLTLGQVHDICGAQARAAARVVVALHARLAPAPLPARVTRGANGLVQIGRAPGVMRVRTSGTPHDYLDVPAALLDGLSRIVDRPLAAALASLRAGGTEIDDDTLRSLIDFEVLVPA